MGGGGRGHRTKVIQLKSLEEVLSLVKKMGRGEFLNIYLYIFFLDVVLAPLPEENWASLPQNVLENEADGIVLRRSPRKTHVPKRLGY